MFVLFMFVAEVQLWITVLFRNLGARNQTEGLLGVVCVNLHRA